jgi:hypothetical protein
MTTWWIIWHHVKACRRDLRAVRLGNAIETERRPGGQIVVSNGVQEWRLQ